MKPEYCTHCGKQMTHVRFNGGGAFYCPSWTCAVKRHFYMLSDLVSKGEHSGVCALDCRYCYSQYDYDGSTDTKKLAGARIN